MISNMKIYFHPSLDMTTIVQLDISFDYQCMQSILPNKHGHPFVSQHLFASQYHIGWDDASTPIRNIFKFPYTNVTSILEQFLVPSNNILLVPS